MINPMQAHIALGVGALGYGVSGLMQVIRYRSDSKYYDSFKMTGKTEYYKLSDQIRNFAALGIGLTLGVTSILAAFGIAVGVNAMLWGILGLVAWGSGVAVNILRFLAYDGAYSVKKDSTSTTADVSIAKTTQNAVKLDGMRDSIMDTSIALTMFGAAESLAFEYWNMTSDEDQATAIGEWEEAAGELAKSVAEQRETAGLTAKAGKEEEAEEEEEGEEGEGEEGEEGDEDAEEGDEEAAEED